MYEPIENKENMEISRLSCWNIEMNVQILCQVTNYLPFF